MRFAAPVVLAALAALALACSPSDEPADPTSTTVPAPRPAATAATATSTTAADATATAASPTSPNAAGTSAPAAGPVISVTVAGGRVTPAAAPVDVRLGSAVVLEVTADVADEVHVHGYERRMRIEPNQPARLVLMANVPGQFEVELEAARLLLFTLSVS